MPLTVVTQPGTVLQVVGDTLNTAISTSSTSFADTGLSVDITPTASTSKFLVQVNLGIVSTSSSDAVQFRLMRDSTEIGEGSGAGTINCFMHSWLGASNVFHSYSNSFLDSPSQTTQITYKLQWKMSGSTDTGYLNRRNYDNFARTSSNFTVTEIAG